MLDKIEHSSSQELGSQPDQKRQRRCDRNRKRSKRRSIFCPLHGCYLDSVSRKYWLYTENPEVLRQRGISRRVALMLIATETAVRLDGEWIECFWCPQCQEVSWYHIRLTGERQYLVAEVSQDLWSQAAGVIHPDGNPSVSAFTRRQARMTSSKKLQDFKFL